MRKCILIVIDSLGCGDAPDAHQYNSLGANTLSNTSKEVGGLSVPNLSSLGIGKVTDVEGAVSYTHLTLPTICSV